MDQDYSPEDHTPHSNIHRGSLDFLGGRTLGPRSVTYTQLLRHTYGCVCDTHTYAYAILMRSVYVYLDRFYTTHTDAYAIPIRMHTERASRHAHTSALPRLCTGPPPVFCFWSAWGEHLDSFYTTLITQS
jgi:hypothetical protein